MQSVSSRIWTRVAVSNSYDDNKYTTGTSSIIEASPSDCFMSYLGHSWEESNPSAEMQSVYSTAAADRATGHSLEESYPSAEMRSVYSTAAADWAILAWWKIN